VLVLFFGDAVELQIDAVLPGGLGGLAELYVLCVAYAVGRGQNAVEANLLGVSNGVKEIG
jgi:hypothetical protein